MFDLTGKKAIVTGSARGIGFALASAVHDAGAEVVLLDILEMVEGVAADMGKSGAPVHAVRGNLMDRKDLVRSFNEALDKLGGRVDILFNNAGIHIRKSAEDLTMEEWDRVVEVNQNAVFELCQLAGRVMIKNGYGKIINTCSMLSFVGGFNAVAYSATKSAVKGVTMSLSNEWARYGVRVNGIAPGYLMTELNKDFPRSVWNQ